MSSGSKQRSLIVPKAARDTYDRFHFAQATRVGDAMDGVGTTQLAIQGLLVEVRAVAVAGSALD